MPSGQNAQFLVKAAAVAAHMACGAELSPNLARTIPVRNLVIARPIAIEIIAPLSVAASARSGTIARKSLAIRRTLEPNICGRRRSSSCNERAVFRRI